jgi:hypothetical protein
MASEESDELKGAREGQAEQAIDTINGAAK